jgi:hypothetical protein
MTRPSAARPRTPAYPFLLVYTGITTPSEVMAWIMANRIAILNCAGNRESVWPRIGERVERFMLAVLRKLAEH